MKVVEIFVGISYRNHAPQSSYLSGGCLYIHSMPFSTDLIQQQSAFFQFILQKTTNTILITLFQTPPTTVYPIVTEIQALFSPRPYKASEFQALLPPRSPRPQRYVQSILLIRALRTYLSCQPMIPKSHFLELQCFTTFIMLSPTAERVLCPF